jgi:hypothetical protein
MCSVLSSIHNPNERNRGRRFFSGLILGALFSWLPGPASAEAAAGDSVSPRSEVRSVRVMDFRRLTVTLTVVLRSTSLVPRAAGQAEIEPAGSGVLKIHARVDRMPPASELGPECLTYVLWAVTPEGRASNLGEILLTGSEGRLNAKMRPSRFGLIVTAEPYFAVSQPSRTVVFEADLAPGASPVLPMSHANCELLTAPVGSEAADPDHPANDPPALLIEEGRCAIAVAKKAGAPEFAPDTLATAEQLLKRAQDLETQGAPRKDVIDTGSEAVLVAEDARVLAVERQKRARDNGKAGSCP